MNLTFEREQIRFTQFGVGRNHSVEPRFNFVRADKDVQSVISDMVTSTVQALENASDEGRPYDPAEKFGSTEHLYLPLSDEMAEPFRYLHEANIEMVTDALGDIERIFCYFARLVDEDGNRLTALRRSTYFKSLGKGRIIQITSDTLGLVNNPLFKLDKDFDLLIDANQVHILRPSGFEYIGRLQEAIQNAVPQNIRKIKNDIPYINWKPIEGYAMTHARAARYLASIKAWSQQVDKTALMSLCASTGVVIEESLNGELIVDEKNIMGLLEVLDRRRYENELVLGSPERFRAASRSRI